MVNPSPPLTLNYAASQPKVRYGRFAVGAAFLAVHHLSLLVWLNLGNTVLEFLRAHGILELTVKCLQLQAPAALLIGVLLLAMAMPSHSSKSRRKRKAVLALAFLYIGSMFFEFAFIPRDSGWLFELWRSYPVPLSVLSEGLAWMGAFAYIFLCLAGIGFIWHIGRRAGTSWITIAAGCALTVSALGKILNILVVASYRLELPAFRSSMQFIERLTFWRRDYILQTILWLLLAIWGLIRWRGETTSISKGRDQARSE
jgi:hypothetical protein